MFLCAPVRLEDGDVLFDKAARFSAEEIRQNTALAALRNAYFFVREDENEDLLYTNLANFICTFRQRKEKKGHAIYTILPNTAIRAGFAISDSMEQRVSRGFAPRDFLL